VFALPKLSYNKPRLIDLKKNDAMTGLGICGTGSSPNPGQDCKNGGGVQGTCSNGFGFKQ
jgi:hypothetical protein